MSAMLKMVADMLLKEIPPEVRELATTENLERCKQAAVVFIHQQNEIHAMLSALCKVQGIVIQPLQQGQLEHDDSDRRAGAG